MTKNDNRFYNLDCIEGCQKHIADASVDLIITDPPYGINGDSLHKHYNRKEHFVLDGYIEIPEKEYAAFSQQWIKEAERILRPGGSMYIVSGHTNLIHILNALRQSKLQEINHIIWKYNFGVYTKKKYVTSHYHILYYCKPGGDRTFNTFCRHGSLEKNEKNGSTNYIDREDVWIINREYQPGKIKNKNQLPIELLQKMILYSSNESDVVCDLFLGGFSTAKTAIGLNRITWGFELSKTAFDHGKKETEKVRRGNLLETLQLPDDKSHANQGKPWTDKEFKTLAARYDLLYKKHKTKRQAIDELSKELGRGYFSILNALKKKGIDYRYTKKDNKDD